MSLNEIFSYFTEKKQPVQEPQNNNYINLMRIGADLKELMRVEDISMLHAVFLEDYMAGTYTLMPCEKMLNLSFGYSDDLTMVSKMLIECAKAKHEQRIRNTFQSENLAEKPYSVMLYDDKTKRLVGGLTVYQYNEGEDCVACVVNERERKQQLQAFRNGMVK